MVRFGGCLVGEGGRERGLAKSVVQEGGEQLPVRLRRRDRQRQRSRGLNRRQTTSATGGTAGRVENRRLLREGGEGRRFPAGARELRAKERGRWLKEKREEENLRN